MADAVRGFIVQPTYRLSAGRPIVQLFGRLEDGRGFLVRATGERPRFYVEAGEAERARGLGARSLSATTLTNLLGRPVARVEVPTPADVPALRERLTRAGVACYEADVRFAQRFLIDRGLRGSLSIRGVAGSGEGLDAVFDDPQLEPADWTPRLRVLSFDVETDPQAGRVLSIGLHGCGASEVLLLTPPGWSCPAGALACPDERELLAAFCRRVQALDPDVLTGWNVVDFDLRVLQRVAERLRLPLALGRGSGRLRLRASASARAGLQAELTGRVVLDGIQLLRGAFVRFEDYSLDAVAREVLGEGKLLSGRDRAEEILRLFRHEREQLVEYNRTDARLALQILERLQILELAVERSRLTGLPLDRVSSSIAAFDSLYLAELGRRGLVAPSVAARPQAAEPQGGGQVLEPLPGLYRNVLVFDFRSLYPNVIRTFNVDPLSLLRPEAPAAVAEADPIVAPSGAAFSRRPGILPGLLDAILPRREQARRAGDQVTSQALKILMNSFYGVLGTPACRFYDPRLANAITAFGRELLLWCRERCRAGGQRVLYGDTDSLFVESGAPDAPAARALGQRLERELNEELGRHVRATWRVESHLELRFEALYLRLCLPALRHGTAGARKRYAGLVDRPQGARVVFTGLEAVRGDWTPLAREVQRELYARLFSERPVEEYLRQVVAELRAGHLDERLVYRKALRKPPEQYTATTPPHVAAARKLGRRGRGRVAYVVTLAGPEPLQERHSPLDYEHYVEKQVRAVAEPVLGLLGLDFSRVVGDDRQLDLFESWHDQRQ